MHAHTPANTASPVSVSPTALPPASSPLPSESSGPVLPPPGLSVHSAPACKCCWVQRSLDTTGAADRPGEPRSLAGESKSSRWEWVVQLSQSGFHLWHVWQMAANTCIVFTFWWCCRWNKELPESPTHAALCCETIPLLWRQAALSEWHKSAGKKKVFGLLRASCCRAFESLCRARVSQQEAWRLWLTRTFGAVFSENEPP